MPFLSISLDVVGSTALKKRFAEFSRQNNTSLDEHYQDLLKSMFVSMNCFLERVSRDPVLDIQRLFLLKRIGDEFWYTYDLDDLAPIEVSRHSTHMAHALLVFLLDAHFDVTAFLPDTHILEELHWKCTVDLIKHALDSSKPAEDELENFIVKFLIEQSGGNGQPIDDTRPHEAKLALRNKLGLGIAIGYEDGKLITVAKPDFIGLEIDLFFRISREAEESKILAGQSFLSMLSIMQNPASGKYSFNAFDDPAEFESDGLVLPEFSIVEQSFSETRLKGIKGGYSGAYIFNDYRERADYEGFWNISPDEDRTLDD
jgi:hypothetical protein